MCDSEFAQPSMSFCSRVKIHRPLYRIVSLKLYSDDGIIVPLVWYAYFGGNETARTSSRRGERDRYREVELQQLQLLLG